MSESTSPLNEDPPETESWAVRMFAANAASDGSAGLDADTHIPVVAREVEPRRLPVALLAGAGAALVGGLVWAGVVITTKYDIGFLAWFVGAATGLAIVRVVGRPIGVAGQVLAGTFAAGGIIVGKYVIFVHAVRKAFGALLAAHGHSIGYLDTRQMSIFVHNFGSIVRPVYALWVALAFFAAVRTAQGRHALTRTR
jgi:hypothetical protein